MIFIICTKNESNQTNRYWDMVPDGRKHGRRQNYIPLTLSGDNYNSNNDNNLYYQGDTF